MSFWKTLLATLAFAASTLATAAPIIWLPAQNTADAADVITVGEVMEALNGAITDVGAVAVNGVNFANTTTLLPRSFAGALDGSSTGDAGYDGLLNSFAFGGGTAVDLQIGGGALTPGNQYLVQVWFTDLRSCCSARDMTYGDGEGSSVNVNASGAGLGQFILGGFIADDSNQTLSLASNGFANVHISAYQLRDMSNPVPAPSSLLLLGLGALLLGWRRRR